MYELYGLTAEEIAVVEGDGVGDEKPGLRHRNPVLMIPDVCGEGEGVPAPRLRATKASPAGRLRRTMLAPRTTMTTRK